MIYFSQLEAKSKSRIFHCYGNLVSPFIDVRRISFCCIKLGWMVENVVDGTWRGPIFVQLFWCIYNQIYIYKKKKKLEYQTKKIEFLYNFIYLFCEPFWIFRFSITYCLVSFIILPIFYIQNLPMVSSSFYTKNSCVVEHWYNSYKNWKYRNICKTWFPPFYFIWFILIL